MKGLIRYDLLQLRCGVKGAFVCIYLGVIGVLSFVSDVGSVFSCLFVFLSAMFGVASFSYEEQTDWNRYTSAMPLTVRQIVLARYGSIAVCIALGMAAGALTAALAFVSGTADLAFADWLLLFVNSLLGAILYMECLIPLMYRLGAEKGRIAMLLVFGVLFGALSALANFMELGVEAQAAQAGLYLTVGFAAVVLALLPVSAALSVRIRAKREF